MPPLAARLLLLLVAVAPALPAQSLPFTDGRWELAGDATAIDTVDGRESVRFERGRATRRDVRLEDGTIDAEVKVTRRRSFVYVTFRMENEDEYEEFYIRPHKSTLPDAVQYAPVYQGQSAWQLYYGRKGTAAPSIEPDVWTPLRIVLSGRRAAFFLGDTIAPVMVVSRLAREPRLGYIAVSAFLPPGTPGSGPIAHVANVRVRPGVVAYDFGPPAAEPAAPAGLITAWTVGEAFAAPDTALTTIPTRTLARTTRVAAEGDGLVELHRLVRMPKVERDVGVVARLRIVAAAAGTRRLDLGFSDAATVFLNGRPLFYADQSYDFQRRRDGLISLDQAAIYLPLRAGPNELTVIVTDHFGGWGLMGRIADRRGIRVEP